MSENSLLETALGNLSTYDFVGFTGEMHVLFSRIEEAYGWDSLSGDIPCIRKSNRPDLSNLDESVIDRINEKVNLDIELYKRAMAQWK